MLNARSTETRLTAESTAPRRSPLTRGACLALAWVLVATVSPALAQVQHRSAPQVLAKKNALVPVDDIKDPKTHPLEIMANLHARGAWAGLMEAAKSLLVNDLALVTEANLKANYYIVAFAAKDLNGEPTLVHFIMHLPYPVQFSSRLPGIETECEQVQGSITCDPQPGPLHEIFLAYDEQDALVSTYTIERKPNELAAQLPGFAKLIAPNVLAPLLLADANQPNVKAVYATLSAVAVPFDHADIKVAAVVGETAAPTTAVRAKKIKAANDLAKNLQVRELVGSACGGVLATALAAEVALVLDAQNSPVEACKGTKATTACWSGGRTRLQAKYNATFNGSASCTGSALTSQEGVILANAESEFLALLTPGSAKGPKAEFTLENRPFTRFSFGVLNSWIAADSTSGDRVKLDGGKYQADPLSGYLGMAIVNFHPWAYDSGAPSPGRAERFRLYTGVAFVPEFGVGAGVGIGIVRGLVANIGWAGLVVDTLPPDTETGQEPPMDRKNPFKRGFAHALVLGLSFNVK